METAKEAKMIWMKTKYWLYEQLDNESSSAGHCILPAMSDGAVVCNGEYVEIALNEVKKETEKAYYVDFAEAAKSGRTDSWLRWVPKSQVIIEGRN